MMNHRSHEADYIADPCIIKYNQVAYQMRLENYKDNQIEIQKAISNLRQTEKLFKEQLDDLEHKSGKKPVSTMLLKTPQASHLSESTIVHQVPPYPLGKNTNRSNNNIERISHIYQYETSPQTKSIFATEIEETENSINDFPHSFTRYSRSNDEFLDNTNFSNNNYKAKYEKLKNQCIQQQKIIESIKIENSRMNKQHKTEQSDIYCQMKEQINQAKIEIGHKNQIIHQLQEKIAALSNNNQPQKDPKRVHLDTNKAPNVCFEPYELLTHPIKQYKYLCYMLGVDCDEFDQQWNKVFSKIADLENQILAYKRTICKDSVDKRYDEITKQFV